MTLDQADAEVEGGIAAVAAALGDRNAVAPFFRIPGLMRGDAIERYLASRSLMTWSVDFAADDWLRISAREIAERALRRIEAKGRGMLLLHDIKPATVLALPIILRELKSRGYRIVHVEPATVDRVETATLPAQWLPRNNGRWPAPELSIEVLLAESVLLVPALSSFGLDKSLGNLPRVRQPAQADLRRPAWANPVATRIAMATRSGKRPAGRRLRACRY